MRPSAQHPVHGVQDDLDVRRDVLRDQQRDADPQVDDITVAPIRGQPLRDAVPAAAADRGLGRCLCHEENSAIAGFLGEQFRLQQHLVDEYTRQVNMVRTQFAGADEVLYLAR